MNTTRIPGRPEIRQKWSWNSFESKANYFSHNEHNQHVGGLKVFPEIFRTEHSKHAGEASGGGGHCWLRSRPHRLHHTHELAYHFCQVTMFQLATCIYKCQKINIIDILKEISNIRNIYPGTTCYRCSNSNGRIWKSSLKTTPLYYTPSPHQAGTLNLNLLMLIFDIDIPSLFF